MINHIRKLYADYVFNAIRSGSTDYSKWQFIKLIIRSWFKQIS